MEAASVRPMQVSIKEKFVKPAEEAAVVTPNVTSSNENIGKGLYPLDHIDGYDVRPGFFRMNGAYQSGDNVSFTVNSHGAYSCTLLLFKPMATEPYARIRIPDSYRIGDTYSILVFGLKIEEFEYAYQFDGPNDPAKGKIFDPNNIILDPYARAVTGQRKWGDRPEGGNYFVYKARVVKNDFDWGNVKQLEHPFEDLVIYETHVRGFTKDASSGVEGGGTFEGLRQKIPYLKDLGINAVELMPIFEFDEMESARMVDEEQLYNYWGYNTVSFFAPNTSYAFHEEHNHEGDELKRLIRELKENGIEVILDVVFNHTAEGNEMGPSFCFKGIDNNIYYMLTPDGHYYNFSGCGNVMNCNHPVVRRFIIDCLRHWAVEYRVDGFRFDLASILGRDQNGAPMENPPILEALAFDTVLSDMKLIAEAWDAGGLYQVGSFPSRGDRWAEWNGKYRDDLRCFLKGDSGMATAVSYRILGSQDLYPPTKRGECASVNFITCHDGFTLNDLFTYNFKHNEANGWDNTDGESHNNSWNCGIEGETDNQDVNNMRRRLQKNAAAILMCSRGTPMFLAGDEFGNTQFGNNNAYCQDNEISWLDWSLLEKNKALHDFFRYMIHFRKKHPILRGHTKPAESRFPETSLHSNVPWDANYKEDTRVIGVTFAGRNAEDTEDDIVHIAMNSHWESHQLCLPDLPEGMFWHLAVNTFNGPENDCIEEVKDMYCLYSGISWIQPRSVMIFVAAKPQK